MFSRFFNVIALVCLFVLPVSAQTVRFDTNVGTFDMELNPTGNANLQGHVDNLLAYVNSGRYDLTVINRAAEDFVMQMGGFQLETLVVPSSFNDFPAVESFGEVVVDADLDGTADFDLTGLVNTRGTVSLALSGPLNSGSSSFFVNIGDNTTSLDPQGFIPFATISDMATIDLIMGVPQTVLSDGGLAGADIPVLDTNRIVFVERAFVLDPTSTTALVAPLVSSFDESLGDVSTPVSLNAISVPEPPALVLAIGALMLIAVMKRSKVM